MPPDHYSVLGIPPNATAEEVRAAYRRLAHENHPDFASSEEERRRRTEKMKFLNDIYNELRDPAKRKAYDERLARGAAGGASSSSSSSSSGATGMTRERALRQAVDWAFEFNLDRENKGYLVDEINTLVEDYSLTQEELTKGLDRKAKELKEAKRKEQARKAREAQAAREAAARKAAEIEAVARAVAAKEAAAREAAKKAEEAQEKRATIKRNMVGIALNLLLLAVVLGLWNLHKSSLEKEKQAYSEEKKAEAFRGSENERPKEKSAQRAIRVSRVIEERRKANPFYQQSQTESQEREEKANVEEATRPPARSLEKGIQIVIETRKADSSPAP